MPSPNGSAGCGSAHNPAALPARVIDRQSCWFLKPEKEFSMKTVRFCVLSLAMVSCMLCLQGCGALQGCPEHKVICRMM
jgi:hypothetical protein